MSKYLPLVLVRWYDVTSLEPAVSETVGFLLYKSRKWVKLAASLSYPPEGDHGKGEEFLGSGETWVIQRQWVMEIKKLGIVEEK